MRFSIVFLLSFFAALPCVAAAQTTAAAPVRHLVYNFTYGTNGDLEAHGSNGYASDTHEGAGDSRTYHSSIGDKGTITVDVVREQTDHGLIVSVSEQAEQTRKANAATCVVYSNTTIICDPNATVNSEELTLLRFMGTAFVDPNQLDAKQHWRIDQGNGSYSTVADYTITSNKDGILAIDENRVVTDKTGPAPITSDVSAKINYNFNKLLPTNVQEYVTRRENQGMGSVMTTTVQTTLDLVSDSMAKS